MSDTPNPLNLSEQPASLADQIAQAMLNNPFVTRRTGLDGDAGKGASDEEAVTSADASDNGEQEAPEAPQSDAPEAEIEAPAPAAAPSSYIYTAPDGTEIPVTADQLGKLLSLNTWVQQLDPQVQEQFGYIEQGRAVAVPTDEYAAYTAWRTSAQAQRDHASRTVPEWVDDLDPEARAAFDRIQAENAQLQQQIAQQQSAALIPTYEAQMEARAAQFDAAMNQYATVTGYAPDQVGEFLSVAVQRGVVGNILEAHRTYSPTGVLLQDADLSVVAREAIEFGRSILGAPAATAPAAASDAPANPNIPTPAPALPDVTNIKKARAASLAAAPSAATSPPQVDPRTLNQSQTRSLVADLLRAQGMAS